MEDEKTIILRKPVILGGVTYDAFDLREPNAAEIEKASKYLGNISTMISLIGLVAKVPRAAVEKISRRDLEECATFLDSFTIASEKNGETILPD